MAIGYLWLRYSVQSPELQSRRSGTAPAVANCPVSPYRMQHEGADRRIHPVRGGTYARRLLARTTHQKSGSGSRRNLRSPGESSIQRRELWNLFKQTVLDLQDSFHDIQHVGAHCSPFVIRFIANFTRLVNAAANQQGCPDHLLVISLDIAFCNAMACHKNTNTGTLAGHDEVQRIGRHLADY